MKGTILILLLSLSALLSCNNEENKFQVGDCIQNPDSIIVWKVKSINDGNYTLHQKQDKREPDIKTIKLDGIWSKSNCPNF